MRPRQTRTETPVCCLPETPHSKAPPAACRFSRCCSKKPSHASRRRLLSVQRHKVHVRPRALYAVQRGAAFQAVGKQRAVIFRKGRVPFIHIDGRASAGLKVIAPDRGCKRLAGEVVHLFFRKEPRHRVGPAHDVRAEFLPCAEAVIYGHIGIKFIIN